MAQTNPRARRSPLRPIRRPGLSQETSNIDTSLDTSFTTLDEHVIRMRTLRSSPRRRSSILNTSEISLLGSPGMSPDSSFDTTFDTSFGSDISASTPIQGPRIHTERVRKRLLTSAREDADTSLTKGVTPPKRKRSTRSVGPTWRRRLGALSQDQLLTLFDSLTVCRPEIQQDIERLLPTPDVTPLLDNLEYFRHNIYKSLPQSKWGTSRDAFCFRRVKTHVDNFKTTCITQGKQLLESESFDAAIEYILKSADYVERLPDWENAAHNKAKQQCFRGLATQCKAAVKYSAFDKLKYVEVKAQIQEAVKVSSDFHSCLEVVEKKIQKCK